MSTLETTSTTDCPHCGRSTAISDPLCSHCSGFVAVNTVLLLTDGRMSVADGTLFGIDCPVILLTCAYQKDGTDHAPITIGIRADGISGFRNALMDGTVEISVRIANGSMNHDEDCTSQGS